MLKFARKSRDLALEGRKAHKYDEFTRKYRIEDLKEYAEMAAGQVADGGSVLDIATGPGYFCTELAKLGGFKVTGIDISQDLVDIARANARQAGVEVDFLQGNASAMRFPDEIFDLVFCSWAVKNFREPAQVLGEMYRVLKPEGTALIIDLNHDATGREWRRYASSRQLKGITALSMKLAFMIQRSGAYSRTQFAELAGNSPFGRYSIQDMGINLCIFLSK